MENGLLHQLFALEGKVVLITGAAGSIGRVLAEGFASVGATVALSDINITGMEKIVQLLVKKNFPVAGFLVDLSEQYSICELVRNVHGKFGRIDVLINCAAINRREPILDVVESTYEKIMAVNLRGTYQLSQSVAPLMISQRAGKIIHIGSINNEIGLYGVSVYGAAKAAVCQLTKSMAIEWAGHNIQVNCIIPGFMRTELTVPLWQDEKKADWMRGRIAMGRPGEPEELLGVSLLLPSPASSYITGQNYIVDGGMSAGGSHW